MPYREPEYKTWLSDVCHELARILACEADIDPYGIVLTFRPFATCTWRMRFEEPVIRDCWCRHYDVKPMAYEIVIAVKENWSRQIFRKDESND